MLSEEEVEGLKNKISELEKQLQSYQGNSPEAFFNEMNRWVNNSTEFIKLKSNNIEQLVTGDNKEFERMMVLIKNTRENVEALASLRLSLGIKQPQNPVSEKEKPKEPITPESMADVLGDNKRQQV